MVEAMEISSQQNQTWREELVKKLDLLKAELTAVDDKNSQYALHLMRSIEQLNSVFMDLLKEQALRDMNRSAYTMEWDIEFPPQESHYVRIFRDNLVSFACHPDIQARGSLSFSSFISASLKLYIPAHKYTPRLRMELVSCMPSASLRAVMPQLVFEEECNAFLKLDAFNASPTPSTTLSNVSKLNQTTSNVQSSSQNSNQHLYHQTLHAEGNFYFPASNLPAASSTITPANLNTMPILPSNCLMQNNNNNLHNTTTSNNLQQSLALHSRMSSLSSTTSQQQQIPCLSVSLQQIAILGPQFHAPPASLVGTPAASVRKALSVASLSKVHATNSGASQVVIEPSSSLAPPNQIPNHAPVRNAKKENDADVDESMSPSNTPGNLLHFAVEAASSTNSPCEQDETQTHISSSNPKVVALSEDCSTEDGGGVASLNNLSPSKSCPSNSAADSPVRPIHPPISVKNSSSCSANSSANLSTMAAQHISSATKNSARLIRSFMPVGLSTGDFGGLSPSLAAFPSLLSSPLAANFPGMNSVHSTGGAVSSTPVASPRNPGAPSTSSLLCLPVDVVELAGVPSLSISALCHPSTPSAGVSRPSPPLQLPPENAPVPATRPQQQAQLFTRPVAAQQPPPPPLPPRQMLLPSPTASPPASRPSPSLQQHPGVVSQHASFSFITTTTTRSPTPLVTPRQLTAATINNNPIVNDNIPLQLPSTTPVSLPTVPTTDGLVSNTVSAAVTPRSRPPPERFAPAGARSTYRVGSSGGTRRGPQGVIERTRDLMRLHLLREQWIEQSIGQPSMTEAEETAIRKKHLETGNALSVCLPLSFATVSVAMLTSSGPGATALQCAVHSVSQALQRHAKHRQEVMTGNEENSGYSAPLHQQQSNSNNISNINSLNQNISCRVNVPASSMDNIKLEKKVFQQSQYLIQQQPFSQSNSNNTDNNIIQQIQPNPQSSTTPIQKNVESSPLTDFSITNAVSTNNTHNLHNKETTLYNECYLPVESNTEVLKEEHSNTTELPVTFTTSAVSAAYAVETEENV